MPLQKQPPSDLLAGRRLLVVEDEYFLADEMAGALAAAGAEIVSWVGDRSEAADMIDSGRPIDAAVLDINLHGEMAYPLADALRMRDIPFVFATGYDRAAILDAYQDVPRWEKPFDADGLVLSLSRLLG